MFLLVRTEDSQKPQHGITFLLLDMDSPGIKVEPILFASGTHEVNQVFFDDVSVPKSNIVGMENEGWKVAKYLLEFEKGGSTGSNAAQQVGLHRVKKPRKTDSKEGGSLLDDTSFQKAKRDRDSTAVHSIHRVPLMAALPRGKPRARILSIEDTIGRHQQQLTELSVEAIAEFAAAHQPEARTVGADTVSIGHDDGKMAFTQYFNLRASSIAGGTNRSAKEYYRQNGARTLGRNNLLQPPKLRSIDTS